MIDDDYSDNDFEVDYSSKKPSAPTKGPIKKDFWDPPKSTVVPAALGGPKVDTQKKPVAADENDYEDDDFDEDEEENFKVIHIKLIYQKTAVEFAKQLKDLKKQNDVRKAQVESLSNPKGKAVLPKDDDYEDDY